MGTMPGNPFVPGLHYIEYPLLEIIVFQLSKNGWSPSKLLHRTNYSLSKIIEKASGSDSKPMLISNKK
jgi:hypothetical protein